MECRITFLDNPLKIYAPGDVVELLIELHVNQIMRIEEIYLKMYGNAHCEFLSRKSKSLTGHANYIDKRISLMNATEIQAGKHSFMANVTLPLNIPGSLENLTVYQKRADAFIRYNVEVSVNENSKFQNSFLVIPRLDLNDFSTDITYPVMYDMMTTFPFDFCTKQLYMSVSVPRQMYSPGEKILVTINIDNLTRTRIQNLKVSLNKILILKSTTPIVEVIRLEVMESMVYCEQVKPSIHRVFDKIIRVPAIEPNIENCELIKVAYEISVKAKPSGMHRCCCVRLPIIIGTVPLKDKRRYSGSSYATTNYDTTTYNESNTFPADTETDV